MATTSHTNPPTCSPSGDDPETLMPPAAPGKSLPAPAGTLRVEILSAKNLRAEVLGSLLLWSPNYSNPFVVVTLRRETFTTSVKDKTLNPTWKEMGRLKVPLPTDQELLQTVGFSSGTVFGGGAGGTGTMSFQSTKLSKTLDKTDAAMLGFQACHPELHIEIWHRPETPDRLTAAGEMTPITRQSDDKLLGEVTIPVLPCIMASTSSHRAWHRLQSDDGQDAGQIQIAMNYDAEGLEPLKGDIVRLAGFGGMEYYAKFLNATTRLEVAETYQDQVLVQGKSQEGWHVAFEMHRNLLHVVRRPSLLRDAHDQLHGQIVRAGRSSLGTQLHRLWEVVSPAQQEHVRQLCHLAAFTGQTVYGALALGVTTMLQEGLRPGLQACVQGSNEAAQQISTEFFRVYWTPTSVPRVSSPPSRIEGMLEGGPLRGRGKVVKAFGGSAPPSPASARRRRSKADSGVSGEDEEMAPNAQTEGAVDFVVSEDDDDGDDEDDNSSLHDYPDQLICPITGDPMVDPVVAADGHTYERAAISHWLATSNISPMTGALMPTKQVFPNFTLRQLSEQFHVARSAPRRRR